MKTRSLTIPEIMLIAGTRVAMGVGVGMLLSGKLTTDQRKAAGLSLLTFGALSSIPILIGLLNKPAVQEKLAA